MQTFHAPAERMPTSTLLTLAGALHQNHVVQALLDGYPEVAVLLNQHRQIVACNQAVLSLLGVSDRAELVGQRLGEVLACAHARDTESGCGTSESCQTCGAVNAMLQCQQSTAAARGECQITTERQQGNEAWDLEVVATPITIQNDELMVFTARDIAAAKRRAALERLFFHDTLNVAGGIHGLAELLRGGEAFNPATDPDRLHAMSRQLIEQISAQRDLAAAERGELAPVWSTVSMSDLFHDLRSAYETHPVAARRTLVFKPTDVACLQSDRMLLSRVLGNLIKNALEASEPQGTVTIACGRTNPDEVRFTVHNETVMPREVQLQVFNRSFSTKGGTGRGLGTFSVKLLTTQHLHGRVAFESAAGRGTTFTVAVPLRQAPDWQPTADAPAAVEQQRSLAGRRILLAEDGVDNQRLIAHVLRKAGAEVCVVENGQQALDAALAAAPFDAILMDMQMPVLDGYAATEQLRAAGYTAPIIALTAHALAEDRERCLAVGCDDYAAKPINRADLIAKIHALSPQATV